MIKIPEYFDKINQYELIKMDDFSFVIYNHSAGQKNIQTFLTKSMFALIINGEKIIHAGGGDIHIKSGEAFFAEKGAYLLSEKISDTQKYQSLIFFIDDEFLNDFINKNIQLLHKNIGEWKQPDIYKITTGELLSTSLKSFLPYFSINYSNKKELLRIKFEELLFHLINTENGYKILRFLKSSLTKNKRDIADYMNKNFILPLTLHEFANQTSRSLTVFKKEFKELYNQSPKKWINDQRLEKAYKLLTVTDKNVTEVCFDVGFNNVSHFIQLFKQRYGITPKKLITSK